MLELPISSLWVDVVQPLPHAISRIPFHHSGQYLRNGDWVIRDTGRGSASPKKSHEEGPAILTQADLRLWLLGIIIIGV